jgi:glucose-6-phosphate isomerase
MTSLKELEAMTDFSQYASSKKLEQLAKHPFDLTQEGHLTPERIVKFNAEACGYKLFYGTERIDEETMDSLFKLAQEADALKKMEKMQAGETMNFIQGFPSENRAVLHTATRDFFSNSNQAKAAQEATQLAKQEVDKLKAFLAQNEKFKNLYVIGIGGSDLGPQAHYLALKHLEKPNRTVHFISNIDPDSVVLTLQKASLEDSLVLVNSKSGTTLETATNEAFVREKFKQAGLKPEKHFISISCKGSPLDNPKEYLHCFYVWDWVGGRFASTSLAGGFILAFACGFDTYWEFLKGANAMDKAALNHDIPKNLPLLGALLGIWNRNFLKHPMLAIIPYSQALRRYSAHLQQLDMESNGKRIDQRGNAVSFETGPIVFGEPGTSAQHSFFQLIHQGTTTIPIEFIGFKNSQCGEDFKWKGTTSQDKLNANLLAQALALATGKTNENPNQVFPGNRPSHLLLAKQLTPSSLGTLLAYYEHKIAFQGFIWGINSFDQEGVQLGKQLAMQILERMAGGNSSSKLNDAYLKILQSL